MKIDHIKTVSNSSVMDNLKYEMLCARPDIFFVVGIMNGYWSISLLEFYTYVKHILKYL